MTIAEVEAHRKPAGEEVLPRKDRLESRRYLTLDAYRGFIMLILASEGFGFSALQADRTWPALRAGSITYPGTAVFSGT